MSPEQARGQSIDPRTDIFTFGIVFYEMLTGEAPFQVPSGAETMSAIINSATPPLAPAVKGPMVPALTRVVERCLEKNPEDRYQTARDLASELRRVKRDSESGARVSPASPERPSSSLRVLGIAAIAGLLAAAYFLWPGRENRPGGGFPASGRFSQLTSLRGREMFPSLSPDGRSLVYVANAGVRRTWGVNDQASVWYPRAAGSPQRRGNRFADAGHHAGAGHQQQTGDPPVARSDDRHSLACPRC
jgi:serine/threonine protein kinase